VLKTVRLPEAVMERVTAHIERLQARFTFARVTENMALRDLLERGLKVAEEEAGVAEQLPLPVKDGPPGASAVEQAAAVAVSAPTVEQRPAAPAGMQYCAVNAKHRPYPLTWTKCPTCANTEASRNRKARRKQRAGR
jgi:hypothetical protein